MKYYCLLLAILVVNGEELEAGNHPPESFKVQVTSTDPNNEIICQEKGDNYVFPVVGYCNYFHRCLDGKPQTIACPRDHHFDKNVSACVEGSCDLCKGYRTGTVIPLPNECSKFKVCMNGVTETYMCPENTRFDFIEGACKKGPCVSTLISLPVCRPNQVQRIPGDCQTFLSCEKGQYVRQTCPSGTYFDSSLSSCQPVSNNPQHKCSCLLPQNTVFSNPSDCETYYVCDDGKASKQECAPGDYFNEEISSCIPDVESVCIMEPTRSPQDWEASTNECSDPSQTFYPDESDCTKYFLCSRDHPYPKSCAKGFYFNVDLKACLRDDHNACSNSLTDYLGPDHSKDEEEQSLKDKEHLLGAVIYNTFNNAQDKYEANSDNQNSFHKDLFEKLHPEAVEDEETPSKPKEVGDKIKNIVKHKIKHIKQQIQKEIHEEVQHNLEEMENQPYLAPQVKVEHAFVIQDPVVYAPVNVQHPNKNKYKNKNKEKNSQPSALIYNSYHEEDDQKDFYPQKFVSSKKLSSKVIRF